MKCPLCGLSFKEADSVATCRGCPIAKPCGLMKCPNCGYEIPGETGLMKLWKKWKEKRNAIKR